MSIDIKIIGNNSKLEQILNRDYLGSRGCYVEVGPDKTVLPGKFERFYERILNFEVREDDVFTLAFPKTGSRRTQEMIWLIMNNLDFNKAREVPLEDRSPVLELEILYDDNTFDFNKTAEFESPRCIKCHLPWSLLPNAITSSAKKPKIIVILRGPEDTCTSYYYHAKAIENYVGTWEDFCQLFLDGKVPFGPYWKHLLSLWEQRNRPNVLFVKFNKMKADLTSTIREVATFLGKKLSDEEIAKLCEHLSFNNLKKSKGFNLENVLSVTNINPFVRKGNVGDHKNVMTPKMLKTFKEQRKHYLTGTDLDFD